MMDITFTDVCLLNDNIQHNYRCEHAFHYQVSNHILASSLVSKASDNAAKNETGLQI